MTGIDRVLVAALLASCSSPTPSPTPTASPASEASWPVPAGWRQEVIPFPLEFAPSLDHRGIEELRFPPGFLDEKSPNRWSYAFVWRLEDPALLGAAELGRELEIYFRGLLAAVDGDKRRLDPAQVTATAARRGDGFELTAHIIDTFGTANAVDLVGRATRRSCGTGALWTFVLAPAASPIRGELDVLAAKAACGQRPADAP